MDVKQKTALYSAAVVLMIAGGGFLLKGLSSSNIAFLLIGSILLAMGIARYLMVKKLMKLSLIHI